MALGAGSNAQHLATGAAIWPSAAAARNFNWLDLSRHDFNVSFTAGAMAQGTPVFNYKKQSPGNSEREGHSVFVRDERGEIFHTYSCYSRGNEPYNIHYHYLDLVAKGRGENGRGPFWVRRRDEYDK